MKASKPAPPPVGVPTVFRHCRASGWCANGKGATPSDEEVVAARRDETLNE